jgi:hypothetical protein
MPSTGPEKASGSAGKTLSKCVKLPRTPWAGFSCCEGTAAASLGGARATVEELFTEASTSAAVVAALPQANSGRVIESSPMGGSHFWETGMESPIRMDSDGSETSVECDNDDLEEIEYPCL